MKGNSVKTEEDQNRAKEKANLKEELILWLKFPNIIAILVIVGYVLFLFYMLGMTEVKDDIVWTRSAYLLTGYEAIAFAAAGFVFGKEVHRQQAEKAEERADRAEDQASESQDKAADALTKGYRLAEAVKARASAQGGEMKVKGIGVEAPKGDWDYLAGLADELFP